MCLSTPCLVTSCFLTSCLSCYRTSCILTSFTNYLVTSFHVLSCYILSSQVTIFLLCFVTSCHIFIRSQFSCHVMTFAFWLFLLHRVKRSLPASCLISCNHAFHSPLSGGHDGVHHLDDAVQGGVGADGHVCAAEVVVDRADHADNVERRVTAGCLLINQTWRATEFTTNNTDPCKV